MQESKHNELHGRFSSEQRFRLALCALLFVLGIVTVICVRASLDWVGEPFNGFLMGRNRIVAPIDLPTWSGRAANIPYWWQLVAVDDKPIASTGEARALAGSAGEGTPLRYTFANGGETTERAIPVITFSVADWFGLFANYLVNGLALLAIGFFVAFLRPDAKSAWALLLFSLSWGSSLILGLADFASFHFRSLLAIAEGFVPASLFYLTLCFPSEKPLARHRRRLLFVLASSAVLAALNVFLYDLAPLAWTYAYRAGVVWVAAVVALSVYTAWREQRDLAPIEREKLKIVLLGMLTAFALPFLLLGVSHLVGAELPLNIVTAGWWIFPATLAYAIIQRDLFEIDVFLRRAATYVVLSTVVFALYAALLGLFSHGFHNLQLTSSPWFALLFSLAVLAAFHPLRDRLQRSVDRLFFRTHFDYAETTRELSQALNQTLTADRIASYVGSVSQRTMAPTNSAIYRATDDGFKVIGDGAGEPGEVVIELDRRTGSALTQGRILHGDSLDASTRAALPPTALVLPLLFEKRLEGFLHLGPKSSGASYGPRDIELLRTMANQTAMALRNAASYDRVTELLASLETRVEERTRELEQTQAELRASNEKLRELDRVKTQFFADASHELRTPLTLVLGPLEEVSQEDAKLPAQTKRRIEMARSNAATLLVLTDTLLDISRIDSGQMKPTLQREALRPLLEATIEPFRWLAEQRKVELTLHVDPEICALCDRAMMNKIVGNLLANALKFTSAGRVSVTASATGDTVDIDVSDTGPGIPAAELPTIFERYHQGSSAGRSSFAGSGIGLALVRELIEAQGGGVSVKSKLGGGTIFRVTIPSAASDGASASAAGIPAAAGQHLQALAASAHPVPEMAPLATGRTSGDDGNAETVLVVDDNPEMLGFVCDVLAGSYRLCQASDSASAMEILGRQSIDLIVSDVMMPGPDGIALCETLKGDAALRHIPLILLTARASLDSKLSGFAAGADEYLTKPFHPDELKARIAALLRMRAMERQVRRSHDELATAYDELRDAQAQLAHADKMAALGTLVAGVAHEINNPVSFIHSSIDLISRSIADLRDLLDRHLAAAAADSAMGQLRGEVDSDERFATLLENAAICRDGAQRAARIVQDLRSFSRPATDGREPTDLHESIEQSLRLLQGELHGRITIEREFGEIPLVLCNAGQMSQVFLNLLANAVQAIPDKGTIAVRTSNGGDQVIVSVADTGPGMSADTRDKIFDPFFTTKEVGRGTGLGLSIVRSLVRSHGGEISVASAPGDGTTFTVSLPTNGAPHEQLDSNA